MDDNVVVIASNVSQTLKEYRGVSSGEAIYAHLREQYPHYTDEQLTTAITTIVSNATR